MSQISLDDLTVVITNFFSGDKLDKCLSHISPKIKKIIIDNGNEVENKKYYESKFENLIYYLSKENLGVPRSYSLAHSLVKTKYMFNTQPDVIIKQNCIEKLIQRISTYPNAIILSPIIFHNSNYYADGDYKVLKKNIKNKIKTKTKDLCEKIPDGDLSVDAVTGTAMLIDRSKLSQLNDWDKNIFNYYEDMDLCLRAKSKGFEIIKIKSAEVDHMAFSSHDCKHEDELNFSRNWHYSWSHLYFKRKHENKLFANLWGFFLLAKSLCKCFFYFFISKKKFLTHYAKSLGFFYSLIYCKSFYRPNIKNKN